MKISSGWPPKIFLLVCLLSLTPLAFYPYHISPYQYPKLLLLSSFLFLSVLFWAFDSLLAQGGRPAWDPVALFLLAFILWALLRYPWFSNFHATLRDPFLWGNLGLTYFLVGQYGAEEKKARALIYLLALVGVAICLYGLLQFGGIDLALYQSKHTVFGPVRPEGKWGRPFSTLGNPNFLGEFLAGLLPLVLALYLSSTRKAGRLVWAGSALASVLLIVTSGARGALVAAVAGIILFFFLGRGKGYWRKGLWLLLAALVFILVALSLEGARSGFSRAWQKMAAISSPSQGSVGARLLWWRVSWEMVKDRPLLGVGTGAFREAYPAYQRRFFQQPDSTHWIPLVAAGWKDNYNATLEAPHNEYLQIAAELGLPGLLLFSAFSLLLLGRRARNGQAPPPFWTNGCIAGCAAILVAALFGFPLHLPSTGTLFFLMAGLLGQQRKPPPDEAAGKGDPLFGTLLVLVSCLALLQLIQQGKVFESGRDLYWAIGHQLSGKADLALTDFSEAKRLNPQDPEIDYWLGLAHLSRARLPLAKDSLERAKTSFNSPRLYLTLGAIHSDLGELGRAEAIYQEGIATYPGLTPLHAALGVLYARSNRNQEALRELKKAQEIDPSLAETYHFLGHLFYRLGRPGEAQQNLERFLQLAPAADPRRNLDLDLMRKIRPGSKSP